MKHFAKLALVSAMAMSSSAFAMEAMEDEALAEATGQDGVTISITPPGGGITMSTVIHDADMWAASANPAYAAGTGAGAIVIGNPIAAAGHTATNITTASAIIIDIDAAADVDAVTAGSQGAALGIKVTLPSTTIQTGTISAAVSNGQGAAVTGQTGVIMDNLSIALNGAVLFMTLGNEATGGQMMRFGSTLANGLTLSNFALKDANGGGTNGSAIRATQIKVDDLGAANNDLAVDAKIDVVPQGLQVNLVKVGESGMDVKIQGLKFGDTTATAPAIGNVDIVGLNLAGTIIGVRGH